MRKSVLQEAMEVAGKDRSRDYGHPLPNHERIAEIWSAILGVKVSPEDVVLCMIGMKIARQKNKDKRDNLVDICGYVRCLEMFEPERKRRESKKSR
jgi:hypothetical protein